MLYIWIDYNERNISFACNMGEQQGRKEAHARASHSSRSLEPF